MLNEALIDLFFLLLQPPTEVNFLCKCTVRTFKLEFSMVFLRRSKSCFSCTAATGSGLACCLLDNQQSVSCLPASSNVFTELKRNQGWKKRRQTVGI